MGQTIEQPRFTCALGSCQSVVAIKKGVQYEIIMRTNTSGANVYFLNIGAQIIDTSLVEVV